MSSNPIKWSRVTWIRCALGIIVLLALTLWLTDDPPTYEGHTVNHWIRALIHDSPTSEKALKSIGLPALPYLVNGLERRNRTLDQWRENWRRRLPQVLRPLIPKPFPWNATASSIAHTIGYIGHAHRFSHESGNAPSTKELDDAVEALATALDDSDGNLRLACIQGLNFIGPNAAASIPALLDLYETGTSNEKARIGQALFTIGPGTQADRVAATLQKALMDSNPQIRLQAIQCSMMLGEKGKILVPRLSELLQAAEPDQLRSVVQALACIGEIPEDSKVEMTELIHHADIYIQNAAAIAILGWDSHHEASLQIVKESLKAKNPPGGTLYLLSRLNHVAKLFRPELEVLTQNQNKDVARIARQALESSSPR